MGAEKELLLMSAARLYSVGVDLETAREHLRELVERGVPYGSQEMRDAYQEFSELESKWKNLEAQYLDLRDEIWHE